MKQTAVQWLVEQLENHNGVTRSAFENVIQQAKQMEKEQIIESHIEGSYSPPFRKSRKAEAEQYYNETFKSE